MPPTSIHRALPSEEDKRDTRALQADCQQMVSGEGVPGSDMVYWGWYTRRAWRRFRQAADAVCPDGLDGRPRSVDGREDSHDGPLQVWPTWCWAFGYREGNGMLTPYIVLCDGKWYLFIGCAIDSIHETKQAAQHVKQEWLRKYQENWEATNRERQNVRSFSHSNGSGPSHSPAVDSVDE